MRFGSLMLVGVAAVLAACAQNSQLVPAPGANALPAPPVGAEASAAGVSLKARTEAWSGAPSTLPQDMTPLLVSIDNGSRHKLRLRYNDFKLVTAAGRTFMALPPFRMKGTVTQPITPEYSYNGFWVAPYLSTFYPGFEPFADFGPFDSDYYGAYYPAFAQVRLPTPDMLRAALPEGVLDRGGSAEGFLYFQHVPAGAGRVVLHEALETPHGQRFGAIRIPFVDK